MKKVLVIGATGAMGSYLVPELLSLGYKVDAVSLDHPDAYNGYLHYIRTNDAKDFAFVEKIVQNGYDAIVDFMIYPTADEVRKYCLYYRAHCEQYIYLSTYRIYADSPVITESSPRLLDVTDDKRLLTCGDYCIYKAEGEDVMRASADGGKYTILRPAVTYSKRRFQLVTLEAETLIPRIRAGKTVLLPEDAMNVQATMSHGRDVARMIARLVLNPYAYGETYTVATAEHHAWGEIAEMYKRIAGLKYETVPTDTYCELLGGSVWAYNQVHYDRLFNRVIDNNKILTVTGMKQSSLMPLENGLSFEYSALPKDAFADVTTDISRAMDAYLAERNKI